MMALAEHKCKYVMLDGAISGTYVTGRYCKKLVFTGEPFLRRGLSIALPRNSNYTQPLSLATLDLNEKGLLPTVDGFLSDPVCDGRGGPSISFARLRVFFFLVFGVCAFLFLEMICDPQDVGVQDGAKGDGDGNSDDAKDVENQVVGNDEGSENGGGGGAAGDVGAAPGKLESKDSTGMGKRCEDLSSKDLSRGASVGSSIVTGTSYCLNE